MARAGDSLHRGPPGARGRLSARAPSPLPPGPASSPALSPGAVGEGEEGRPLPARRSAQAQSALPPSGPIAARPPRRSGAASVRRRPRRLRSWARAPCGSTSAAERGRRPRRVRQVSAAAGGRGGRREHRPPRRLAWRPRPAGPGARPGRCRRRRGGRGRRPPHRGAPGTRKAAAPALGAHLAARAASVAELLKSRAARSAGDVRGSPVPGFSSALGPA